MNATEQVAERIKEDLRGGGIDPAKRLPGYRALGIRYGVSGGTVRSALELLESASVLQRRNRSGTYVSPLFQEGFEEIRNLVLVFPEKTISLMNTQDESYFISMEIFRGLMREASDFNARVGFQYMPATDNQVLLEQQLRQLKGCNGVVMIGQQLKSLSDVLHANGIPVLTTYSFHELAPADEWVTGMDFGRTSEVLCDYLIRAGYRRLVLISEPQWSKFGDWEMDFKRRAIQKALRKNHIMLDGEYQWDDPRLTGEFHRYQKDRIFFVMATHKFSTFYRYAYANKLVPGKDFDLLGIASGFSLENYFPPVSYLRLPYFELGRAAARKLLGEKVDFELVANYIQGESSRKVNK